MPNYEFYCEKCKKEVGLTPLDQRARAWRLQVSGLRREDAEAADGRVLLEDLAEVLALIGVRTCIDAVPGSSFAPARRLVSWTKCTIARPDPARLT